MTQGATMQKANVAGAGAVASFMALEELITVLPYKKALLISCNSQTISKARLPI